MKKPFLLLILFSCSLIIFAQTSNVGIGTSNPDPRAILDLSSNEKGLLIPRMTEADRLNIPAPIPVGLMVFDVTSASFWYYGSAGWTQIGDGQPTKIIDPNGNTEVTTFDNSIPNVIRFKAGGNWLGKMHADGKFYLGTEYNQIPEGQLHIVGQNASNHLTISPTTTQNGQTNLLMSGDIDTESGMGLRFDGNDNQFQFVPYNYFPGFPPEFPPFSLYGNPHMVINRSTGNVGISVDTPQSKLHIVSDIIDGNTIEVRSNGQTGMETHAGYFEATGQNSTAVFGYASSEANSRNVGGEFYASGRVGVAVYSEATGEFGLGVESRGTALGGSFIGTGQTGTGLLANGDAAGIVAISPGNAIVANGDIEINGRSTFDEEVFIGTESATFADGYMLNVDGKIISEEVLIQSSANWPDYVFEQDYDLMDLESVEAHILQHQHLPNIPSAKEIENSGIQLGEMQKLQMEKIEELTLYIIELKKEIDLLKKRQVVYPK